MSLTTSPAFRNPTPTQTRNPNNDDLPTDSYRSCPQLATNPFDPHKVALTAYDSANGLPSGFLTLPDLEELSILAIREGMDLLARLHDEDLIEE